MKCLLAYAMCVLVVVNVRAHLPGPSSILPQPIVPVGSPLIDPFRTGPGMLRGGWNNMFLPQGHMSNFGQWPHTWDGRNTWNNGIPVIENRRDGFNNNGMTIADPWEQYRRFNSGMRNFVDDTVLTQNQLTQGQVSDTYPWNTFATQNNALNSFPAQNIGLNTFPAQNNGLNTFPIQNNGLNTFPIQNNGLNTFPIQNNGLNTFLAQNNGLNTFPIQNNGLNTFPAQNNRLNTFPIQNNGLNTFPAQNNINTNNPAFTNGINQGFVSPQLQPNVNSQFQNPPFLSQRFPNRLPATNGAFV